MSGESRWRDWAKLGPGRDGDRGTGKRHSDVKDQ